MQYIGAIVLFMIGTVLGLRLPDVDQTFWLAPLLVHRSLLTHSCLVPLLLFSTMRSLTNPGPRFFVMGFCVAVATHLCFDLFPRRWYGFALLNVPIIGHLSPWLSATCLFLGALFSLYLAVFLLRNLGEFFLGLLGLAFAYGIGAVGQPSSSFPTLLVLAVAGFIAFILPRPSSYGSDTAFQLRRLFRSS